MLLDDLRWAVNRLAPTSRARDDAHHRAAFHH
jgi:hypothetical protein